MDDKYDLQISDLPSPLNCYAEAVGINGLIRLSEAAGGQTIYIPNKENLLNYATSRLVREDWDKGLTVTEITKKRQISRATVYNKLKS